MAQLPVVDHAAELVRRPVEERLLLRRQHDGRDRAQLVPVGRSGKKLGIKTDGTGFERLRLGVGDLRQGAFDQFESRRDENRAADFRDGEQTEGDGEQPKQEPEEPHRAVHGGLPNHGRDGERGAPQPQRRLVHAERDHARQQCQAEEDLNHPSNASARAQVGRPDTKLWHVSLALSAGRRQSMSTERDYIAETARRPPV